MKALMSSNNEGEIVPIQISIIQLLAMWDITTKKPTYMKLDFPSCFMSGLYSWYRGSIFLLKLVLKSI